MCSPTALITAWPGTGPSIERKGRGAVAEAVIWGAAALFCFWLAPSAVGQDMPTSLRFADAIRLAEAANPHYLAAQRGEGIFGAQVLQAHARPNPEIILESENVVRPFPTRGQAPAQAQWLALLGQENRNRRQRSYRVKAPKLASWWHTPALQMSGAVCTWQWGSHTFRWLVPSQNSARLTLYTAGSTRSSTCLPNE